MKRLNAVVLMVVVFALTIAPTFAIENAEVPQSPAGIGWAFLFLGLGAVLIIGGVMYARERGGDIEGEHKA